eukprot:m.323800 g.323800  ORF g.323800 m.323800 type:complete len:347 (-) comp55531_c0_seq10:456-1496(-)
MHEEGSNEKEEWERNKPGIRICTRKIGNHTNQKQTKEKRSDILKERKSEREFWFKGGTSVVDENAVVLDELRVVSSGLVLHGRRVSDRIAANSPVTISWRLDVQSSLDSRQVQVVASSSRVNALGETESVTRRRCAAVRLLGLLHGAVDAGGIDVVDVDVADLSASGTKSKLAVDRINLGEVGAGRQNLLVGNSADESVVVAVLGANDITGARAGANLGSGAAVANEETLQVDRGGIVAGGIEDGISQSGNVDTSVRLARNVEVVGSVLGVGLEEDFQSGKIVCCSLVVVGVIVLLVGAVRETDTCGRLQVENVRDLGPGVIVVVQLVVIGGVDVQGAVFVEVSLQ